MSSSATRGADASRHGFGIETPRSEDSFCRQRSDANSSRSSPSRRQADAAAMDHLLKPSIAVKAHPPNLRTQPRVLFPLMLLPREHLPLSCLDLSNPDSELAQSRFVESHIKILDLESRLGAVPSVLIARSEGKGAQYALERFDHGLYVMCRLGSWVDLEQLVGRATALAHDRLRPAEALASDRADTPKVVPTSHINKEHKKKRAAIEAIQSLVRKKTKSRPLYTDDAPIQDMACPMIQLPSPNLTSEEAANVDTTVSSTPPASEPHPDVDQDPTAGAQQTGAAIFDSIRAQYFEALYRSMGSLAYFAKGPLSRARSAFHLDLESNLDMGDLVDFLKSLVLTTVQIDKKYRETIPALIENMKSLTESSDEGPKKKRRPRKMKLGKDSLYPMEDESIRQWWGFNKPEPHGDDASPSVTQIRSHASLLRTRETQLQMIVILEILALEPLKGAEDAGDSSLPTLPGAATATGSSASSQTAKKRNKHNLPVLVDVHADRLTIWQSTATDDQLLLEDSQALPGLADTHFAEKSSSEPLKDFCVDVIVPFFSPRLPELCNSINRKLGGPVVATPIKSRSGRRSSSKREQKPGAATKRPGAAPARRTLQRALSTEQFHRRSVSRGPSSAIALMRSATSTSVSGVKREGSEPLSIKDLPWDDTDRTRRPSLARSSSSMASSDDHKADKKALVEAQLKDAISALRKPNREVIGRAMAEADERRAVTGLASKKTKRLPRSSLASVVQVKATPANNRFKDVLAAPAEDDGLVPLEYTEDVIPPSSVGQVVPSTGQRRSHRDALAPSTSPAMDLIGVTPVKSVQQRTFIRRMGDESAVPASSPLTGKTRSALNEVSGIGNAGPTGGRMRPPAKLASELMVTPVKKTAARLDIGESPVPASRPAVKPGVSIYQTLGWDDDFDDI